MFRKLLPVVFLAAGLGLLVFGLFTWMFPAPAPLPEENISVPPGQVQAGGPDSARVKLPDGEPGDGGGLLGDWVDMTPDQMAPNRLFIPSIGAYAQWFDAGIRSNELVLDPNPALLSRWTGGSTVTSPVGTILMSGHINYNGRQGVLAGLSQVRAGDRAFVTDADGNRSEFMLVELTAVVKAALPADIWNPDGDRNLVVVTCGGPVYNGNYRDNVVAKFIPVPA